MSRSLAGTPETQIAATHVRAYVEWQAKLITALPVTTDDKGLKDLVLLAGKAAEGMSAAVNALRELKLSEKERRQLYSVASTRQYELYGNRDMSTALRSALPAMQPRIMQVFQPYLPAFIEADRIFTDILVRGYSGQGWQRVSHTFDAVFQAAVVTVHRDVDTKTAPYAIVFTVRAEQPNDPEQLDSMTLFEYFVPWKGANPTKEELEKWISYDREQRIVTFNCPRGTTSYKLPAKRKQDGADQPAAAVDSRSEDNEKPTPKSGARPQ